MAYTKYHDPWADADGATGGGDESTPLTAAALDHIEAGIAAAIPDPGSATTAHALVWNGSAWVADTIKNARIDAAAAIAYSKLNLTASIVNADIASAAAIAQSKLSFDAFTAWTPTKITQDASDATDIAHTVNYARYARVGNLVFVYLKTTFTAAGTSGQSIAVQGLPVTAAQTDAAVGSFRYSDSGTANYAGTAALTSATTVRFIVHNQASSLGAAPSFAIASTDNIWFALTYEAA